MTRIKWLFGLALLMMTGLGAGVSQAATTICVLFESQMQGSLPAASQGNSICGTRTELLSFEYGVTSPRDQATGQSAGKRQHKAVKIKKRWNAASVHLFRLLKENDLLTRVSLDFLAFDPRTSKLVVEHTINLTNAFITVIEHSFEASSQAGAISPTRVAVDNTVETIELVFQQIELVDSQNNVTVKDSVNSEQ